MNYVVHPDKIAEYLLNIAHPTGAPKAKFFLSRGFSTARPDEFSDALKRHPVEATLTSRHADPEGRKLTYECEIVTPDGSRVCIRSIWMEAADLGYTRLITAYPFL